MSMFYSRAHGDHVDNAGHTPSLRPEKFWEAPQPPRRHEILLGGFRASLEAPGPLSKPQDLLGGPALEGLYTECIQGSVKITSCPSSSAMPQKSMLRNGQPATYPEKAGARAVTIRGFRVKDLFLGG